MQLLLTCPYYEVRLTDVVRATGHGLNTLGVRQGAPLGADPHSPFMDLNLVRLVQAGGINI